jgi:hypothetical protein
MSGNRRKRAEKATPSKRLNVMLREESITRLMLHVVMMRKNPGDILSDLIEANLRHYKVQVNNPGSGKSSDRLDAADQASESIGEAA